MALLLPYVSLQMAELLPIDHAPPAITIHLKNAVHLISDNNAHSAMHKSRIQLRLIKAEKS